MAQQKPHDVNEPSRRRLLKGIGALGGALAITGGCPVAHAAKAESSPGTLTPDARQEKQPFYGEWLLIQDKPFDLQRCQHRIAHFRARD